MVVIGSGNVAWHMVHAFSEAGINVLQVLARNEQSARKLSGAFSVPYIMDPGKIHREADIYLLAVQDDQIRNAASKLHLKDQFLVHTSGFSALDVLKGASSNYGVLWPLQSLTAGRKVKYSSIPLFIEANTPENETALNELGICISKKVMATDSQTRQKIHLAAVISSNLTNHLYAIAASILDRQEIPFDVLSALITETAAKAALSHPLKSQTGPAVRNDLKVIEKHLDLLREEPAYRDIYQMISENIIHHHKNE